MNDWNGPPPDEHTLTLPVDRTAELALIGAVLLGGGFALENLEVGASDFFHSDTRRTFQSMLATWERGEPLDFVLIPPTDDDGTVTRVLLDAQTTAVSEYMAPAYAARVRALAEKRRLLDFAQRVGAMSLNGATPEEIIDFAQAGLEERRDTLSANPFDRWNAQGITAAQAAQAEPAERLYLVQDLIRAGSLAIFYGNPGDLKSALVMDAMLCIANGRPWLEPLRVDGNTQRSYATRQASGLWLNYDQGHEDVLERLGAMARTYGGGENVTAISHSDPAATLTSERQARKLGRWIANQGYGLVVVDSLLDVRGAADLQEAAMGDVLRLWRIVCEESGAAVIMIAHSTKATQDLYGSQFIKAKLDHAYHVTRAAGTDIATIEAAKQRSYGETNKIVARWTYTHIAGTRTLYGARFWGDSTGAITGGSAQDAVRAVLTGNPGRAFTANAVAELLNEDRQTNIDVDVCRVCLNRLTAKEVGIRKLTAPGQPNRYCFGEPLSGEID